MFSKQNISIPEEDITQSENYPSAAAVSLFLMNHLSRDDNNPISSFHINNLLYICRGWSYGILGNSSLIPDGNFIPKLDGVSLTTIPNKIYELNISVLSNLSYDSVDYIMTHVFNTVQIDILNQVIQIYGEYSEYIIIHLVKTSPPWVKSVEKDQYCILDSDIKNYYQPIIEKFIEREAKNDNV